MSGTTYTSTFRSLLAAGVITTAYLAAPAASQAQIGEGQRVLQNRIAVPSGVTGARGIRFVAGSAVSADPVNGERALLVRIPSEPVPPGDLRAVPLPVVEPRITGARALMGTGWSER